MTVKDVRWPALAAVAGSALLVVLDGTVVAVALDTLAHSFEARLDQVLWATTGYLLAVAAVLPMLSYLTARFGPRRLFVAGLLLFLAGSGLTALAWSVPTLILFRVVQGLGGGLVEPTAMTLAAGFAPPNRMGRVMGVMAMVINLAPVAGPLVGGLLLQAGPWQWIFVLYVLFVVIGLGFGVTAAPTVAGAFRLVGPGEQAAGSTALFMIVQFGASVGVTLLGLLQAVVDDWVAWLFLVVAAAQVMVFGLGSRLSGTPEAQALESGQLEHLSSP
jgi:MFS family permease